MQLGINPAVKRDLLYYHIEFILTRGTFLFDF